MRKSNLNSIDWRRGLHDYANMFTDSEGIEYDEIISIAVGKGQTKDSREMSGQ